MTLSDALPVQFWLGSAETYNEKDPQGVFAKCFCQPWECDDIIPTQFQAATGEDYSLLVKDSDGIYLSELTFTEIATGVYTNSFTPETEGICDENISLEIIETDSVSRIVAPDTGWTDQLGSFTKTSNSVQADVNGGGQEQTHQNINIPLNGTMSAFTVLVTISNTWSGTVNVQIEPRNSAGFSSTNSPTSQNYTSNTTNSPLIVAAELCDLMAADWLMIYVFVTGTGTATVKVELPVGDLLYVSPDDVLAKSDCLNIKSTQKETVLITYSDNKNFASLNYSLVSPDPEFAIRVPAVFFHERFPEESEVIELSNSRSIQLNAQVKAQRKLEIGSMPYYMHRKLKLVLKHQFVTIDDQDWVQSETYEVIEGNRRYPLKKAIVWLDEKDYIMRNTL